MGKSLDLAKYHLWLVSGYKNKPGQPTKIIRGWDWLFDQYTNKRARPDRKYGHMDWNLFRGSLLDLAKLTMVDDLR